MRTGFVVVAILLWTRVSGQSVPAASVPPAVQQALHGKYPGLANVAWKFAADQNYVADFHANGAGVAAKFSPAGAWIESSTEIGAITLPLPVRTAVIGQYRGFQFGDIHRVQRPAAPAQLFEIHLSKPDESVTVQYLADGAVYRTDSRKIPPPAVTADPVVSSVTGTWRGESFCQPGYLPCEDYSVVYRFAPAPSDTLGLDVKMSRVTAGEENETGRLACTLDRRRAAVICIASIGMWEFHLAHDSLSGGLTLADGKPARRVTVRRQP